MISYSDELADLLCIEYQQPNARPQVVELHACLSFSIARTAFAREMHSYLEGHSLDCSDPQPPIIVDHCRRSKRIVCPNLKPVSLKYRRLWTHNHRLDNLQRLDACCVADDMEFLHVSHQSSRLHHICF